MCIYVTNSTDERIFIEVLKPTITHIAYYEELRETNVVT